MSSSLSEINTKLEAYKLIYDPAKLLSLLYSKYGDIEDDYNIMHIDQLIFNKTTHFNHLFKENINFNNWNEYMRRIYNKKEHDERIVKLADFYKNYYLYFCRPLLTEINYLYFLNKYYNRKAKIFYKNYNSENISEKSDVNNKETESIVTSINNDTDNKIIFNKKNKYIIENNGEKSKYSITLTYDDISNNNNNDFIHKSSASSFENFLRYFIDECKFENYENKNNGSENNVNLINNEKKIKKLDKNKIKNLDLNNYLINTKNIKEILQDFNRDKKNDKLMVQDDTYYKIRKNFYNINHKENSNEISRNITTMNLSANEKRKNLKLNNKNNEVIINEKNNSDKSGSAKINKNFSKLKLYEKEIKDDNLNQAYANKKELSNHQNLKGDHLNNLNNLIKKKDINSIQKFKLINKLYNNLKVKVSSIYKNIPIDIKTSKVIEKKFVSKNINNKNVIANNRLDFKHNELKNVNKIISNNSNNIYSANNKLKKNHKIKNNKELISPKDTPLSRNKIILKRNSKTISKLIPLDSGYFEIDSSNKSKTYKIIKSNLNHSYKRYNKNNLLNNNKFNNIPSKLTRNINIFRSNPISKSNSCLNILINNNYFSRNKNNIKFFNSNSLGLSLASSLSKSKSKNKENEKNKLIMKFQNFMTRSIDNNYSSNRFRSKNLKVQRNIISKNRIEEILKNSSILNRNIGKSYINANNKNNIKSSFRKNKKKEIRFPNPINIKQCFNIKNNLFKK
jgi:hypothetical protein